MSDLLSASSLLLAIAAILFSLWHPDIVQALETVPKRYSEDNVGAYSFVSGVVFTKALPVAMVSIAIAAIFLPDAVRLADEALGLYRRLGLAAVKHYDAVTTAYCLVVFLSAALAVYMLVLVYRLFRIRNGLR